MQKTIKKALAFLMAFAVAVSIVTTGSLTSLAASTPTVTYQVHAQTYAWKQGWVSNGTTAGYTGQAKRLEAIQIKVTGDSNLGVRYKTHIQKKGWESSWNYQGAQSGTTGSALRLEAIKIELTGSNADKYDIYYRVHAQSYGWLGWAKNGAAAGTAGQAKRLEAIQIKIVKKGADIDGTVGCSYVDLGKTATSETGHGIVNYNVHVQSYGDQKTVSDGAVAGTFGEAKRLESIKISLDTKKLDIQGLSGGIQYQTHVQKIGWQGWKSNGAVSGTSGQAKRLEAIQIRLTGEVAQYYDVYYRVHAQTYGWMAWAKNGQTAGTAGQAKRLEGIQICVVPKGSAAPNVLPASSTAKAFVSTSYAAVAADTEVKATAIAPTLASSINVGKTATIATTFSPSGVTNKRLTYTSSDESIATVSNKGVVTAVAPGEATITVKTTDGSNLTKTVKVTVVQPLTSISVSPAIVNLKVGETQDVTVAYTPANASNKKVTYSAVDTKVATVSESGKITAVGRGTTQILITSAADSTIQTAVTVNVTDAKVTEIKVKDSASATVTFSGVGSSFVKDLDTAVKDCQADLKDLEGEDWIASDGSTTYKVVYKNGTLTYYENGSTTETGHAELQEKINSKGTLTLTAPVKTGKANSVLKAAYAVQNDVKYSDSSDLTATITVDGETIELVKIGSQYSSVKIGSGTYNAYFTEDALNIVGDVTKDAAVKKLVDKGIITAEYK